MHISKISVLTVTYDIANQKVRSENISSNNKDHLFDNILIPNYLYTESNDGFAIQLNSQNNIGMGGAHNTKVVFIFPVRRFTIILRFI